MSAVSSQYFLNSAQTPTPAARMPNANQMFSILLAILRVGFAGSVTADGGHG